MRTKKRRAGSARRILGGMSWEFCLQVQAFDWMISAKLAPSDKACITWHFNTKQFVSLAILSSDLEKRFKKAVCINKAVQEYVLQYQYNLRYALELISGKFEYPFIWELQCQCHIAQHRGIKSLPVVLITFGQKSWASIAFKFEAKDLDSTSSILKATLYHAGLAAVR